MTITTTSSVPQRASAVYNEFRAGTLANPYLRQLGTEVLAFEANPLVAIVDVEATCFEDPTFEGPSDIIEIGWALLDTQALTIVESAQIYVAPTSSEVSAFCTRLTGITPAMVENAMPFTEALARLASLHEATATRPAVTAWAGYGEFDRKAFSRQCARELLGNPTEAWQYFNAKSLVSFFLEAGRKRNPGMAKAMAQVGLSWQGRHHCGYDDAINTAQLLATLVGYARTKSPT